MGMDSLNDMFFTSTASESLSYDQILEDVQNTVRKSTRTSFPRKAIRRKQENCCGNLFSSMS